MIDTILSRTPQTTLIDHSATAIFFLLMGRRLLIKPRAGMVDEVVQLWSELESPRARSDLLLGHSAQRVSSLDELLKLGVIQESDPSLDSGDRVALVKELHLALGAPVNSDVVRRLELARVDVVELSQAQGLVSRLQEVFPHVASVSESTLEPSIHSPDRIVVIHTNSTSWNRALHINRLLLKDAGRRLLAMEDQFGGTLGPLSGRPGLACFHCYALRRESNMSELERQLLTEAWPRVPVENHHIQRIFREQWHGVIRNELLKLVMGSPVSLLPRSIVEFDFLNHRHRTHPILPLMTCPTCGPALNRPAEFLLPDQRGQEKAP